MGKTFRRNSEHSFTSKRDGSTRKPSKVVREQRRESEGSAELDAFHDQQDRERDVWFNECDD